MHVVGVRCIFRMKHAVDKCASSWAHRITASFCGILGFEVVGTAYVTFESTSRVHDHKFK